jgi:hypothetical protein
MRRSDCCEEKAPQWGQAPQDWDASDNPMTTLNGLRPANAVKKRSKSPVVASLPRYRDHSLDANLRARASGQMLQSSNCPLLLTAFFRHRSVSQFD